jgi:hypothetical protein
LDPSYDQYRFETAVDEFHSYLHNKTSDTEETIDQYAFGTNYWQYQAKMWDWESFAQGTKRQNFDRFLHQPAIRTINNTVYEELKQIGGGKALLSMGDRGFVVARDRIVNPLHTQLTELRDFLDALWCSGEGFDIQDFQGLVPEGEGHTICEAAMEELWRRNG